MLRGVARAPPPGGEGGVAGLGVIQLPSPRLPGPHSPVPKWEDRSYPLPPSHTPATCPVPEANREETASQRGRAHNFAASGRTRAGVQGSSCRRQELGEFISPPICGGAAEAAVAVQGAASRASRRRWPRSRRSPAPPASLGLWLCRPPRREKPAPVLKGQLSAPPGPPARSPLSPFRRRARAAAARREPHTPLASVLRLPGAAAHLEAAPAPPWRPAWGRHLLCWSPRPKALSGVGSAAAAPRSSRPGDEAEPPATTPGARPALGPCRRERPALPSAAAGPWGTGTCRGDSKVISRPFGRDSLDGGLEALAHSGCSNLPRTFLAPPAPRLLSPWKSSLGRPESHFPAACEAEPEPGLCGAGLSGDAVRAALGGGRSAEKLAKQPPLRPGRARWYRKGFGAIGVVWVSRSRRAEAGAKGGF